MRTLTGTMLAVLLGLAPPALAADPAASGKPPEQAASEIMNAAVRDDAMARAFEERAKTLGGAEAALWNQRAELVREIARHRRDMGMALVRGDMDSYGLAGDRLRKAEEVLAGTGLRPAP